MVDGRGSNMTATRMKNVARVKKFLAENPTVTQKECAEKMELSVQTIHNIRKELAGKK